MKHEKIFSLPSDFLFRFALNGKSPAARLIVERRRSDLHREKQGKDFNARMSK